MADTPRTTDQIDELCYTPGVELVAALRRRDLSPVEVTQALLDRIDRVNPEVNAFVTLRAEEALAEAKAAEKDYASRSVEELGPLHGMPVTVKDLTPTAGVRTTFGHKSFADHVPDHDGPIWARLKAAGAILLGKTATPEFGEKSVTESDVHGITNNPWDLSRTVGGSSGGAAACVVSGMGPFATGSDGGGSIRVPSSLCGAVGLKASRGRIPVTGDASPLDEVSVVGPITRTVRDNAYMLNIVAGPDPYEMFALYETGVDYVAALEDASVEGLRIAYSPDLGAPPIEAVVRDTVRAAADVFDGELGAHVDEVALELPDVIDYFIGFWGPQAVMMMDDAIAAGVEYEETVVNRPLVEKVRQMSAVDYARVLFEDRERLHRAFAEVFVKHDLLIWPTTPMVAYPHPGPIGGPTEVAGEDTSRYPSLQNQRYTEAIAHAGYPAISIPAGFTADGLPVGLQIAGPHGADAAVLRAAAVFEQARPWADRRPNL